MIRFEWDWERCYFRFARPLKDTCKLVLWEGGFHELHNEPLKEEVFKTMTDWMNTL